jgi:D-inositol-3-phosphate glycosyltransferase
MRMTPRCVTNCADWGTLTEKSTYRVLFVEAIGGHRGMHHYDFALCSALAEQGVDLTLFTCDETHVPQRISFPVELAFQGIFGQAPAWQRGLRYGLALARIARRRPRRLPGIVHVHFFHALPLDYAFLAWMSARGCRLVVSAHDVHPFDAKNWSMPLVRRIYDLADALIAHSHASHDALLALDIARKPVAVIPLGHYLSYTNGVAPSPGEARRQLGLPPDAPVLLFFGQIKEVKGLDVLLRALSLLAEQRPNIRLIIAGSVWKDNWYHYAELIDQLALQPRLDLHLRYITDDEVAAFFAAANAVVLPYRHVYQSAVLMLALSFGRPVVTTRVGGLAEVVQDGETGYLTPPDDPEALAAAINRILDDPQTAQIVGKQGQALARERYSWSQIATMTRKVYEETVNQ